MTKKFYAVLLIVLLTPSYVQAQFSFGGRMGYNLTKFSEKDKYQPHDFNKFLEGFQIGVVGEYAVSDAFAIQPVILLTTQRGQYKHSNTYRTLTKINYLQIPINALYKLNLGDTKLLLQAGAYFGYALSGKRECVGEHNFHGFLMSHHECEQKIKFGKQHMMKPFDFGLGLGAGLQLGNVQAGVGYNIGLANLSTYHKDWNHSLKNRGWAITLTHFFGKNYHEE